MIKIKGEYFMFKKMLSAFSISAVALSIFFTKGVKADQVRENSTPSGENTSSQREEKQSPVSNVTQGEVDAAKADFDRVNRVVSEAQRNVEEARQSTATAKDELKIAQQSVDVAKEAVESAPTALKEAQSDLATKLDEEKKAEANLASSKTELEEAQSQVDHQAQSLATAKEKEKGEAEKATQAQQDVDVAQSTLTESTSDADTNLEQAKTKVAASQTAVDKAQQGVEKANQSDEERQKKLAEATANKSKADDAVLTSKQAFDDASAKAEKTQSALETAKATLSAAKNIGAPVTSNTKNTFYMTPEYIAALKQLADPNTPQSQISQIEATLTAVNDKAKSFNNYVADPNDSKTLIDTNNIPYDVRLEISQFTAELINQIRSQMGTGEVVVTPSALEFADKVAREYKNDNWSWDLMNRYHHDAWGINRVAREYGLVTTSSEQEQEGIQYYENAYIWKANTSQMSVADMKRDIYFSLVEFMYNGYEWVHAKSISGLNTGGQKNYLGVDFSMENDITVSHFTMVSEDQVKYASKNNFDATPIGGKSGEANQEKLEQAQTAFDVAQAANNQAQADKENAKTVFEQAQLVATQAQTAFDEAAQTPLGLEQAKQALEEAKNQLETDKEALRLAQTTANNVEREKDDKVKALSKARDALSIAQKNLTAAQADVSKEEALLKDATSTLADAIEKRDTAQEQLVKAQTAVMEAKSKVSNLVQAEEQLSKAEEVLEAAEQKVKAKEAAQLAAIEQLSNLQTAQAATQVNYNRLVTKLKMQEKQQADDYYREILDQTDRNLAKQDQRLQTNSEPPTPKSSQILLDTPKQVQDIKQISTEKSTKELSMISNAGHLPSTGSRISLWIQLSGIVLIYTSFRLLIWEKKDRQ